jgi:hypothetical protein
MEDSMYLIKGEQLCHMRAWLFGESREMKGGEGMEVIKKNSENGYPKYFFPDGTEIGTYPMTSFPYT